MYISYKQMEYKIYIPSHGREDILNSKTLRFLEKNFIEIQRIYILVSDLDEYREYLNTLDTTLYNQIQVCEVNMACQRQFIESFLDNGINIFIVDDDVEYFEYDPKYKSLDEFFRNERNICFIRNKFFR